MKKLAIPLFIFVTAIVLTGCTKTTSVNPSQTTQTESKIAFQNPKKSAHYESNTPAHGSTLAGVPINIVIDFNFDLSAKSTIKIGKDGKDYGIGQASIDESRLTLRRKMDTTAPDGLYTVSYNACWPDGSCHDGNFQFAIDRSKSSSFQDLTDKNEVTVKLSELKFVPPNIKISKDTKVTWINDDSTEHYVNTDSHPAHTYFPAQNSKALARGDSYSVTFNETGIYPYHCSAHPDSMIGNILVQ